ncbi:YncE family protein [Saliphagus sp. GCM10025308]
MSTDAYDHGCTLTRRQALKAASTLALATATGAASSGSALAADGLVDGVVSSIAGAATSEGAGAYAVATISPVGFFGLVGYTLLKNDVNESPSGDEAILHNLGVSEYESLTTHEVTFSNRLTDTRPVASLEARHGIASAWEDGDSSSVAYDRAMQRIRQYYELPEYNHYHVTAKSLLQLGFAAGVAKDDLDDDSWAAAVGTDDGGNTIQLRLQSTTEAADISLHDGTAIWNVSPSEEEIEPVLGDGSKTPYEIPRVEFYDTSSSTVLEEAPILDQSVVDSWDATNEEVTYELSDGTTVSTDLDFTIKSVSAADLQSARVFDGREFFKLLDEIKSLSDTVTGNYSESFVSDIYAELDAGNITPDQVRSPEGIARFLSGTDDVSDERFRISMLQQLGMVQPDFSKIRGMSVNWTGATETWVDPDPNLSDRHAHPDGFVENESYSGVLFGADLPGSGFQTGGRYYVGNLVYGVGDGEIRAYDHHSLEFKFAIQTAYSNDVAVGDGVIYAAGPDGVACYNISDGSEVWTSADTTAVDQLVYSASTGTIAAGRSTDSTVAIIGDADGSVQQTISAGNVDALEMTPDGSIVYVSNQGTNEVEAYDTSDGSTIWISNRNIYYASNLALSPDGNYLGCDGLSNTTYRSYAVLDTSDGTEVFGNDGAGTRNAVALTNDTLLVNGDSLRAYDFTNTSLWNDADAPSGV